MVGFFIALSVQLVVYLAQNMLGVETMRRTPLTSEELTGLDHKRQMFVIEYTKDFNPRRAAEASGFTPEFGYTLRKEPKIEATVDRIIAARAHQSDIDAEWLLYEAVDNHYLARYAGNLPASNNALTLIAKHSAVDALAADRVKIIDDDELLERLFAGRRRAAGLDDDEDKPLNFA